IYNLVDILYKDLNKGKEPEEINQHIFDYFGDQNIASHEPYDWLLNNQNDSNSIYLLGYFNYHKIGTNVYKQKAFELYQKAANLGNNEAQYSLDMYINKEKNIKKDHTLSGQIKKITNEFRKTWKKLHRGSENRDEDCEGVAKNQLIDFIIK